jgi:hypothetical protein
MRTITNEQFNLLQGFMLHCWNVYYNNQKKEFSFWAKQLDETAIPWSIQNDAACLMDKRENGFYYFRNLLKDKGIQIKKSK